MRGELVSEEEVNWEEEALAERRRGGR
jgi:hypothetical protein